MRPKPKILSAIALAGAQASLKENLAVAQERETMEKLSTSLSVLEKIMEEANRVIANMVQLSENNLEAERIKLRRMEIMQSQKSAKSTNKEESLNLDQISEVQEVSKEKNLTDSNESSNEQANWNQSVQLIKSTLENELISSKINIKRDYKLTQKSNFDLWQDYLKSELTSNDLLDVIDDNVRGPQDLSEMKSLKRKRIVRDIIINHLDEKYHKKILNIEEPKEILKKLREYRKSEVNVTHSSVRTRLYQLKMKKDERVDDFCERFDSIIREYETCDDAVPLTDQEKRSAFYQATSSVVPELRNADLIRRQTSLKEMNLEEIKLFLLQLEAERKNEVKEEIKIQRVFQQSNDNRCYRCNGFGHWSKECKLQHSGKWFCYHCQSIKNHKGDDCPFAKGNSSNRNDSQPQKKFKNNPYNKNRNFNESAGKNQKFKNKSNKKSFIKNNRSKPYNRNKGKLNHKPAANKEVKSSSDNNEQRNESGKVSFIKSLFTNKSDKEINFIADSGATEHIVNKSLILSDFKKCENQYIKSANKNEYADIIIDGKGDLLLQIDSSKENVFKLTDVIAAKDISENLLSLRKLVDAGFCIYLDNKSLKVYNKLINKIILEGTYEKPNWVVRFNVKKRDLENNQELKCESYYCRAKMVSNHELPKQSQTCIVSEELLVSEGANKELQNDSSAIGRESKEKLVDVNNSGADQELNNKEVNESIGVDCDISLLPDETVKVDESSSLDNIQEMFISSPLDKKPNNFDRVNEAMLWHVRLGHASLNYLKKLQKIYKSLENVKFDNSILECETCIMAKMEKLPFKETRKRAERPLQVIHTDTMGPISPTSYPGFKRYIVVFIDDYSRFARAYAVKTKDEAGDVFKSYLVSARNLLGKNEKVCYIKSDQGTEFTGGKFLEILKEEKIEIEVSPPYTPEHNGVAERFNKTIQEKVRAYMFDSGLPKSMWEFAVDAAVYAYNRTPHKSIEFLVPLMKFSLSASCHFNQIKRFGCIGYVKVPKPNSKFSERAIKAVLVGYRTTGFLLWHPHTRKFIESRHVKFNEKLVYKEVYRTDQIKSNSQDLKEVNENDNSKWFKEFQEEKSEQVESDNVESKRGRPRKQPIENKKHKEKENKNNEGVTTRGQVKRKLEFKEKSKSNHTEKLIKDTSFINYVNLNHLENSVEEQSRDIELRHCLLASINKDPVNYNEAMMTKERENWKQAIREELNSMEINNVWILVDRPQIMSDGKKANIIDSKWVFKKKLESDGSIRFKARLVIRGFKDRNVYDLKETYAPVSRLPVVRSLLAIINKYNLIAFQLDVNTAFLNGILDEEIYMELPDGLEVDEQIKSTKVCKLKRALYGLKISPKKWNQRFTEEMLKLGLENDLHEPCLFTWRKEGKMAVVLLYVDDMIIAGNDKEILNNIKRSLSEAFKMKDLGEPKNFLGISIERNKEENTLLIHQANYIESILEKFNMKDCKPQSTPMITRQVDNRNKKKKLEENENSESNLEVMKAVPYREAIGSLMYLSNASRPDITFAVNYLSRKQLEPTEEDWVNVKRIFRYLRGTTKMGLLYKSENEELEAYSDASFRDCQDSTSTGGYIIKLFGNIVAWRSHKQAYVTLSTCQAEYLAMSDACQELISLDKSIRFIIGKTLFPVTIWCDNKSAGDCTKKDGNHKLKMFDDNLEYINKSLKEREERGNRKHMAETHGDFVKQCVDEKKVKVMWIATKENLADIMTKPLPLEAHKYLRDKMLN